MSTLCLTGCERHTDSKRAPLAFEMPEGYAQLLTYPTDDPEINCEFIPAFTDRLEFPSRYEGSGPARDQQNALSTARYQQMTSQINRFTRQLSRLSDYLYTGRLGQKGAECVMRQMHLWADNNAMLSVGNMTGIAVRKWNLAAYASNYLKIRTLLNHNASEQELLQLRDIEQWLLALAWQVHSDYSKRAPERLNNHDYWAAWAVIVVATLHQDEQLFLWAESIFSKAMLHINQDGLLPSELRRQSRAAQYHNFATGPLVAVAAFLHANGRLDDESLNKLSTLVSNVLTTIDNTTLFEQQTGVAQTPPEINTRGRLAWLPIWLWLTEDNLAMRVAKDHKLSGTSRLGGDTFAIYPIMRE